MTIARPISAPYSSWSRRSDSGEPSNPDRLARITSGRFPLAALIARAVFFDERGNSVPAVHWDGPSTGGNPCLGSDRDSKPITSTGWPPRCASSTTADSASAISVQRSRVGWSASTTPRSSERMSKGFFRSGLLAGSKISPSVLNSVPGPACGDVEMSRSAGSAVGAGRGKRSPGATYVCS